MNQVDPNNPQINHAQPIEYVKKSPNFLLMIIIGVIIFFAGWSVGTGNLSLTMLRPGNLETQNPDLPEELDMKSVQEVYKLIRTNFDGELSEEELLDGLKKGLARATGDPFTEYFNEEQAKEFNNDLQGTFSGIGAELSRDNDSIVIVAPISGFPAEEVGLFPQDIIVAIDGEDTFDMTLTEAVSKIRGEAGTDVELQIARDNELLDFTITRADIKIPSVETEIFDGNIGYIKISRFSDDTYSLVQSAADELKEGNVNGIILDLRNNPGGLLNSSVDIASLWLNSGDLILEEKRGGQTLKTFRASSTNTLQGTPTIILMNEGSASASEIVAGALRDNNTATIIGQTSFGKGSVQSIHRLESHQLLNGKPISNIPVIGDPVGGLLKITTARWFTPGGDNIDQEGIAPDKEVERSRSDYIEGNDPQKDAALQELR